MWIVHRRNPKKSVNMGMSGYYGAIKFVYLRGFPSCSKCIYKDGSKFLSNIVNTLSQFHGTRVTKSSSVLGKQPSFHSCKFNQPREQIHQENNLGQNAKDKSWNHRKASLLFTLFKLLKSDSVEQILVMLSKERSDSSSFPMPDSSDLALIEIQSFCH